MNIKNNIIATIITPGAIKEINIANIDADDASIEQIICKGYSIERVQDGFNEDIDTWGAYFIANERYDNLAYSGTLTEVINNMRFLRDRNIK